MSARLATQAYANLAYRSDGLASLARGRSAQETLDALIDADDGREHRQAGIVDASGHAATWTGVRCHSWAGGVSDTDVAIQGNILTGPDVVAAMHDAWRASAGDDSLSRRLLRALEAGDAAGGDRRGRQSAALLVVTPGGGYGGGSDVLSTYASTTRPLPSPSCADCSICTTSTSASPTRTRCSRSRASWLPRWQSG